MSEHLICCHFCHESWSYSPPLSRRAECPSCHRDARICRNCRFYDRGAHHECREEQAEFVKEKEVGNFCSFFEPKNAQDGRSEVAQAHERLKALFDGDKTPNTQPKSNSFSEDLARFLASKK